MDMAYIEYVLQNIIGFIILFCILKYAFVENENAME